MDSGHGQAARRSAAPNKLAELVLDLDAVVIAMAAVAALDRCKLPTLVR